MHEKVLLKLFVAGETSKSKKAVEGIREAFDLFLKGRGSLEIIDVFKHPQQAMEEQVLVTPTLIRLLPTPARRVIGDVIDGEKAFDLLELRGKKLERRNNWFTRKWTNWSRCSVNNPTNLGLQFWRAL